MRRRTSAGCLVAALLVLAGPVHAGPGRPGCPLLTDPRGDAVPDELDIVAGDVGSGRKTVVVVLLTAPKSADSPAMVLGARWTFGFTIRGSDYTFDARRLAGPEERYTFTAPGRGRATVVRKADELRWVVPRGAIPELRRPGAVFESVWASTSLGPLNADQASSKHTYRDRAPSCARPA